MCQATLVLNMNTLVKDLEASSLLCWGPKASSLTNQHGWLTSTDHEFKQSVQRIILQGEFVPSLRGWQLTDPFAIAVQDIHIAAVYKVAHWIQTSHRANCAPKTHGAFTKALAAFSSAKIQIAPERIVDTLATVGELMLCDPSGFTKSGEHPAVYTRMTSANVPLCVLYAHDGSWQ
jgi:hypothetical protein